MNSYKKSYQRASSMKKEKIFRYKVLLCLMSIFEKNHIKTHYSVFKYFIWKFFNQHIMQPFIRFNRLKALEIYENQNDEGVLLISFHFNIANVLKSIFFTERNTDKKIVMVIGEDIRYKKRILKSCPYPEIKSRLEFIFSTEVAILSKIKKQIDRGSIVIVFIDGLHGDVLKKRMFEAQYAKLKFLFNRGIVDFASIISCNIGICYYKRMFLKDKVVLKEIVKLSNKKDYNYFLNDIINIFVTKMKNEYYFWDRIEDVASLVSYKDHMNTIDLKNFKNNTTIQIMKNGLLNIEKDGKYIYADFILGIFKEIDFSTHCELKNILRNRKYRIKSDVDRLSISLLGSRVSII
jgi:hypothetical protein